MSKRHGVKKILGMMQKGWTSEVKYALFAKHASLGAGHSMVLDLHAHYPMHLMDERLALRRATTPITVSRDFRKKPLSLLQRIIMLLANNLFNFPSLLHPAVTIDNLIKGDVKVVFSVLYAPFDEMDLSQSYGSAPQSSYADDLLNQISVVESEITQKHGQVATVAHSPAELDQAIAEGKIAFIHAVEGGFHAGDTDDEVIKNIETLARDGVAYITVAHLFFRQVATDAPALPFLPDKVYDIIFPQDSSIGLTPRGQTLIEAMVRNGILIDITHMSKKAIEDTFDLLSTVFKNQSVPVIATHSACQFGKLRFNLTDPQIKSIASSGGVIGLDFCRHFMSDGISEPETFEDSMRILTAHISHICSVTNSSDHVAIGSDLDGFIKPTLPCFETSASFAKIEESLRATYGSEVAEKICWGNALRVFRQAWQRPIPPVSKRRR